MDPKALPIRLHAQQIVDAVRANPVTVVIGETGSGKTTQISQILEEAGFAEKGVIGVTQPRRVVRRPGGGRERRRRRLRTSRRLSAPFTLRAEKVVLLETKAGL